MSFTIRQKRFMAVFIQQAPEELGRFVELTDVEQTINDTVEKTEQIVDAISAAALIASIPTAGSAMAFASAGIVLIKVGLEAYKFIKTSYDKEDPSACLEEAQREEKKAFLLAFLQLVAQNIAIRYRYQIDLILSEKGVNEFAHYTLKRMIKKLRQLKSEQTEPRITMSAPELLGLASQLTDYLLASSNLAALYDTEKVTLEKSHQSWGVMKSFAVEAKLLGARARWALVSHQGDMTFYASTTENELMKTDSTIKRFGYITLPLSDKPDTLMEISPLVVQTKQVKSIKLAPQEHFELMSKMAFFHSVTREEVNAYLSEHAQEGRAPINLNTYLSMKHHAAVIACCHDETLRGVALDHGDFSQVHFYGADLSECSLQNTSFRAAHLGKAIFFKNKLDKQSDFQDARLTWSSWQETMLIGQFSHAIFNGSTLTDCQINDAFLQIGSEWLFVNMTRVVMVNQADELQGMLKRLEIDLQQRTQCAQEVRDLKQQLEQCITELQQVQRTADFSRLETKISVLGQQLNTYKNKTILSLSSSQDASAVYQRHVTLNESVLQDIQERYVLLLSMCQSKKLETEKLERLQNTQKELWDHQHLLDDRLSELEDNQRPLNRLKHYYEDELNLSTMTAERKSFVESLALNAQGHLVPITEEIVSFLESSHQVKCVHGVSGIGKTVVAKKIVEWLLREKDSKEQYTPHYIDLRDVKPAGSSNFLTTALGHIYSKTQLDAVKEDSDPLLILLDHVETASTELSVIFEDCARYANPNWKFIFFAKTAYLMDLETNYREVFQENYLETFSVANDCALQPFNNTQIRRFISAYLDSEALQRYHQLVELNPDLIEMMRMPILLTLIVWTFLLKKPSHYSPKNATMHEVKNIPDFYSVFWSSWHKHAMRHLPEEWREFETFKEQMKHQALIIYKSGIDYCDYEWRPENQADEEKQNAFIGLYHAKINDFSPLYLMKVNDRLRVRFMHSSLWFNLVCEALITSLLKRPMQERLGDWNKRYFVDNNPLLTMLIHIIKSHRQREQIETELLALVEQIKLVANRDFNKIASNALTVLARLKYVLKDKNYSDLNLSKVDLTKGIWIRVTADRANFTNAKLIDMTMLGCSIKGSNVHNARFLAASTFVQFCSYIKTYAIYPSKQDVIIAYVLAAPTEANKISILKRTKQGAERLAYWVSHKQAIRCVDFAIYGEMVRFASAGDGGKISVSEMQDGLMRPICSLTGTRHKKPLNLLKFAPDGNLIASLCEENYLRVWNVNQRLRQSKFNIQDVAMTSLLWRRGVLLTGGSDGIVYSWRQPTPEEVNDYHAWIPARIDFRSASAGAVQSMALSLNSEQMAIGFQDGAIAVMYFDNQKTVQWLNGHTAAVTSLVFTSEALASGSSDYTLRLWRNRVDVTVLPHEYPIGKIDLLWDGRELISGAGIDSHWLYFWDLSQYTQPSVMDDHLGVVSIVAAYKNRYLAAGFMNGAVAVWQLNQPKKDPIIVMHHRSTNVSHLEWSPSGDFLLSRGNDGRFLLKNTLDSAEAATELQDIDVETRDFVWGAMNEHDVLLTCPNGYGINLWTIGEPELTGRRLKKTSFMFDTTVEGHGQDGFDHMAVVPGAQEKTVLMGQTVLMVILSNRLGLYICYLKTIETENKVFLEPMLFALDATAAKIQQLLCLTDRYLVIVDEKHTVTLLDTQTQSRLHLWQSKSCITSCFMSSNSLFVATSQDIYYWDLGASISSLLWYEISPTQLSIQSTKVCAQGDDHLVIAKHHGIALFDKGQLLKSKTSAWQHSFKSGFFVDESDMSNTQGMSPQTEELLKSNQALCSQKTRQSGYSFFSSNTKETSFKLPAPSDRAQMNEDGYHNIDFSSDVIRNNSSQGFLSMDMD